MHGEWGSGQTKANQLGRQCVCLCVYECARVREECVSVRVQIELQVAREERSGVRGGVRILEARADTQTMRVNE